MNRRALIVPAVAGGALAVRRARARAQGRPPARSVPPDAAQDVVAAVLGQRPQRRSLTLDFPPATASSWELLIDGPAFFPRMLADIESARSDVHILIFGFRPGEIGNRFRDVLVRKAREGLGVRVSVEGGYSQPELGSRPLYSALRAGGVEIVANQGAMLDLDGLVGARWIDWRFDDLAHFDHRKLVIVDGRVAFVGGPGIEDHFADDEFHDVMFRLEGPIVAQLQALFLLSWHFQAGPLPATAADLGRFFPEQPATDGVAMQILANNPGERHLPIEAALRGAIAGAARRLDVISPYLADWSIISGILAAAERGVRVRVIVPADPRSLPASAAVRHWFPAFRQTGVDVREYPRMAHAKVLLADDTVIAGTANLDGLSLHHNWEIVIRSTDPALADHVGHALFDRDAQDSTAARMPVGRRAQVVDAVLSRAYSLL